MITNHDSDAAERMKAMREIEGDAEYSPDSINELVEKFHPVGSEAQLRRLLGIAYLRGQIDATSQHLKRWEVIR